MALTAAEGIVMAPFIRTLEAVIHVSVLGISLRGWLDRRLRIRTESLERRFDRLLTSVIEEFNDVLSVGNEGRPEGAAREALKERAGEVTTRLEALTPPSAEWRELVGDYVELMAIHLQYFGDVVPENDQRRFAEINRRATLHREALRESNRSKRG